MTDLANLAMSLRDNGAFQAALDRARTNARDALCKVSPDDRNGILKAQATVDLIDDIRGDIEAFIRSGEPRKKPGIA